MSTADGRELLRHPTWADALLGTAIAWLVFSILTAVVSGVVSLALMRGAATLTSAALIATFALLFSGVAGAVVALAWALPVGMLVATVLAGVGDWRAHAAAQFGLGAVTGLLVPLLATWGTFPEWFWPIAGALAALTGSSAAAGWLLTWRAASRRGGPKTQEILAGTGSSAPNGDIEE